MTRDRHGARQRLRIEKVELNEAGPWSRETCKTEEGLTDRGLQDQQNDRQNCDQRDAPVLYSRSSANGAEKRRNCHIHPSALEKDSRAPTKNRATGRFTSCQPRRPRDR